MKYVLAFNALCWGVILFLAFGCGGSQHTITAEGETTITHQVRVDDGLCEDLKGQDKIECLKVMVEVLKQLSKETQDVSTSQD
jgi:hypothetical protein